MKKGPRSDSVQLSLAIEHLEDALRYLYRGRRMFFDERNPDTYLLVEGNLRKAVESMNKLDRSFWLANPKVPHGEIRELRNRMTHEYEDLTRQEVWDVVSKKCPFWLRTLKVARVARVATVARLRNE